MEGEDEDCVTEKRKTSYMVDSDKEFEPHFDYTCIQPIEVICCDDNLDETPVFCSKKQKLIDVTDEKKAHDGK
ncbi:hypothetical protein ACS0TY_036090 [Phlomoides rotata]